jgi:UDP-N-acetylglucosamine--N-acetylmuramyl-(pentapeptide) pyrophosphoryl-undecaprenol N-acetylglucosamine transferase
MVAAFAAADLVVSRAGATTSFELMAAGRAALMVPLPGQLEQRRNAEVMQEAGAARMILQEELSGERLARELSALVRDPGRVTEMSAASRRMARGDAAVAAVDLMEKLVASRQ